MVDVLPDTSIENNTLAGTGWIKKVEKRDIGSTTVSMKLDGDGFLYHNIPLNDVTKVDILNRMYSEPQKKRKCCDNIINKETNK